MKRILLSTLALSLAGLAAAPAASADVNMGYLSYDAVGGGTAEFDIVNNTGANSSGDASFPVTTPVSLSNLSLMLTFSGGATETLGPSYFTLNADGLSWDGTPESMTAGPPAGFGGAISATLTGMFDTTSLTLFDGSTITIDPSFSATISDPSGLKDGDLALITASAGGVVPTVPEPGSFLLVGTGLSFAAGLRRRRIFSWARKAAAGCPLLLLAGAALVMPSNASAASTVKLNTWTAPSAGQSGLTFVNITGSGFPSGTISPGSVTVYVNTSCSMTGATSTTANSVTQIVGSSDRIQFEIPNSLATGTYYVSISGSTTGGTSFSSSNCSEVNITAGSTTLAACVPTSSLAITVGSNVNAYVPFGSWAGYGTTGIEEVPLEGSGTARNFATTGLVNSCAANSTTGEVVCTENNTNVDLINGTALSTLTSGSNTYAGFSGGSCQNCGVGVHAGENAAVIAMGLSGGSSNTGVQFLNLASNTFGTPFPLTNAVSEDISIDSGRGLILSPGEDGVYDLLKIGTGNALTEYGNTVGGELDSAAEDCTTGIALASDEFSDDIYITDLTQASFTSGTPAGTWTAPGQFVNLADGGYSAGTCGLSSAPGTNHLAVVTGEFGGSAYSALQLPSTSGTGTPTLADWAYVGSMPNTPDGYPFSAGFDPHTVTAYTSPNTGKSYAVFVDYYPYDYPSWLGIVDLSCVLTQPRTGAHIVTGDATACTRYVAVP